MTQEEDSTAQCFPVVGRSDYGEASESTSSTRANPSSSTDSASANRHSYNTYAAIDTASIASISTIPVPGLQHSVGTLDSESIGTSVYLNPSRHPRNPQEFPCYFRAIGCTRKFCRKETWLAHGQNHRERNSRLGREPHIYCPGCKQNLIGWEAIFEDAFTKLYHGNDYHVDHLVELHGLGIIHLNGAQIDELLRSRVSHNEGDMGITNVPMSHTLTAVGGAGYAYDEAFPTIELSDDPLDNL